MDDEREEIGKTTLQGGLGSYGGERSFGSVMGKNRRRLWTQDNLGPKLRAGLLGS